MSDCQTCGSRPSSCKLCPGCDSMLGRYQYEHKRMEAENAKLRSALDVAREALELIADGRPGCDCMDTVAIARKGLINPIDSVLQGSPGEKA